MEPEQKILQQFQQMRIECNQLVAKINELEMECREHTLVIGSLEKLDPSRRCFRLVGGVLVERTVGEVIPPVKRNQQEIVDLLKKLEENLTLREKEITEFAAKYKMRPKGQEEEESKSPIEGPKPTTGVLV